MAVYVLHKVLDGIIIIGSSLTPIETLKAHTDPFYRLLYVDFGGIQERDCLQHHFKDFRIGTHEFSPDLLVGISDFTTLVKSVLHDGKGKTFLPLPSYCTELFLLWEETLQMMVVFWDVRSDNDYPPKDFKTHCLSAPPRMRKAHFEKYSNSAILEAWENQFLFPYAVQHPRYRRMHNPISFVLPNTLLASAQNKAKIDAALTLYAKKHSDRLQLAIA